MRYIILLLSVILVTSCAEDERAAETRETTTAQFRIVLRTEPYEPGDALTSGEFLELNLHTFPVAIGKGPRELVSSSDGVVLLVRWEEAILGKRSSPAQPYLMLRGFSYRLCNKLVSPAGSSWWWEDWSEPLDLGLDPSWDHFVTPVPIDPSATPSPVLVLQWRWPGREGYDAADFLLAPKREGLGVGSGLSAVSGGQRARAPR